MSNFEEMNNVLNKQKEYFIKNGPPPIELRIDRLERLKTLIMDNRYDFVESLIQILVTDQKMHLCYLMFME